MENKNLPNNAKKQCRQPQQCRNHRPQVINVSINIGTIVMPVTVNKRGCEQQPSQIDQLVNEVIAAVGKKLQQ